MFLAVTQATRPHGSKPWDQRLRLLLGMLKALLSLLVSRKTRRSRQCFSARTPSTIGIWGCVSASSALPWPSFLLCALAPASQSALKSSRSCGGAGASQSGLGFNMCCVWKYASIYTCCNIYILYTSMCIILYSTYKFIMLYNNLYYMCIYIITINKSANFFCTA